MATSYSLHLPDDSLNLNFRLHSGLIFFDDSQSSFPLKTQFHRHTSHWVRNRVLLGCFPRPGCVSITMWWLTFTILSPVVPPPSMRFEEYDRYCASVSMWFNIRVTVCVYVKKLSHLTSNWGKIFSYYDVFKASIIQNASLSPDCFFFLLLTSLAPPATH